MPERTLTLRQPYKCGILVWKAFRMLLANARAAGLQIEEYPAGGFLVKVGWIKVTGRESLVLAFQRRLYQMSRNNAE